MSKIKFVCLAFLFCSINGFAFGQTTEPTTQPDYQTQEANLAAKILADDSRLATARAVQTEAQKILDADNAQLRDVFVSDIASMDASIAADRIGMFLQDPSENGRLKWAHPELFPKEGEAMTAWCAADVDVINVRDFWFIIDGGSTVHVSATKPPSLDLSDATKWDFPADKDIHVNPTDIEGQVSDLHKKIRLAAGAYPEEREIFYSWTILFQSERANYKPTAWDESHRNYVGGDIASTDANAPLVAENGSYYGEISTVNGLPRTHYVNGYYRADGTYVRSYYRSR